MSLLTSKWPFYISGPLLALTVLANLYIFDDELGMGEALRVISTYSVDSVAEGELAAAPAFDWQLGFLAGIFLGALLTGFLADSCKAEFMPEMEGTFTVKTLKTVLGGMGGGFLIMLGLQLAGDTVYGSFAAAIQLSTGSWIFLLAMVITAAALAILLERRANAAQGKGKSKKKGEA